MARYKAVEEAGKLAHKQTEILRQAISKRRRDTHDICGGCDQDVKKEYTFCPYCGAQSRRSRSING